MERVIQSKPAEPAASSPDPALINPRAILAIVRRRFWPMALAAALVSGVTLLAYMAAEPRYYASGDVGIDRRVDEIVRTGEQPAPLSTDSPSVDTEVQVIRSPALAGAVVDKLHLERVVGFGINKDGLPTDPKRAREKAIGVVQSHLQASRAGGSYAITIGYSLGDPLLAANIVNAAIQAYVDGQKTSKAAERDREIQLLRSRIGQLRGQVLAAESAVAKYRADTNLVDIQNNSTAAQQAMQVLGTQLAQARADQAAALARASSANGSNGDALSSVMDSGVVRSLRQEQATLMAQRTELSSRYGPLHPDLQSIDKRLGEIDQQLNAEIAKAKTAVNSEAQIASSRASSIQTSINRAQGQLLAGNAASVRLAELERNADSSRGLYQAFLDRFRQAVATQGTEQSNAYVIAYARVPGSPISPNRTTFLIGGVLGAAVFAALIALLAETMERGFMTRASLERKLGIPVLGAVPDLATVKDVRLKRAKPLAVADYLVANQDSIFSEAFRSVRTALKIGNEAQYARSIAITSGLADEGKTTTAICLARSAALAGLRVLLVDCDARRRAASRVLAANPEAGVLDVLSGAVPFEKALLHDRASGAHLLPQKAVSAPNYDAIGSREMETLVRRLSQSYDLVVLDTAPVLPVAEARAVAAMADATVLVVRWRKTPDQVPRLALDQLDRAGANLAGAMLTKVDVRAKAAAGMGDEAYYYQGYSAQPV